MRRNVPVAIALAIGLVMMSTNYFPWMDPVYKLVLQWDPVIVGFAFFLSIISFCMHHWAKIKRRSPYWGFNIASLGAFAFMLLVGIPKILFPGSEGLNKVLGNIWGRSNESLFQWLFQNLLNPMEATMFALLAFYIASASFRAFRARNLEATLLLTAAFLIMLGRIPFGEALWDGFGKVQEWIFVFPNTAAKRAITIGVGLGMASTALKLMLGIERSYLGKGN